MRWRSRQANRHEPALPPNVHFWRRTFEWTQLLRGLRVDSGCNLSEPLGTRIAGCKDGVHEIIRDLEAKMTTRKLEPSEWRQYFDEVAKQLPSMRVGISIMGANIGVQLESEDSALIGITYDSKEGFLEIGTPSITHRIANPKEIHVREEGGRLSSVEVIGQDDTKQILELKPLTALPAS